MKYLKKFETAAEKTAWMQSIDHILPNVVLTEGSIGYNEVDYSVFPLHIEAIEDLTVSFGNTYKFSKDRSVWTDASGTTSISAKAGEKVYFQASGLSASSSTGIGTFSISGRCNIGGNIMSMIYGNDYLDKYTISSTYQFYNLFKNATTIESAKDLALPATTLAESCYNSMFNGCTSLVEAPELPATTLAKSCYRYMFRGCTSLVNAPALPATTITSGCYEDMFRGCTSLVNAPALPATTITSGCYRSMFNGCTSLVEAPALPATTIATYCYQSMFGSCTSLVNAPALPATTITNGCYNSMFRGCTSLVEAPELPATTLVDYCYQYMFYDCTSLTYIKMMATDISAAQCLSSWVTNVASSGTFVKNSAATWNATGASGVPSGWTVETADA